MSAVSWFLFDVERVLYLRTIFYLFSRLRLGNEETFSRIRKESGEIRSQSVTLKYVVVTTGVASVIGLYATNVARRQALFAAYDSGKAMATEFAKTAERLDRISARLDAQEQLAAEKARALANPQ